MRLQSQGALGACVVALAFACSAPTPSMPPTAATQAVSRPGAAPGFEIPVIYRKLDNGLKVVLSEDSQIPMVTVAVYYGIGFRIEPRDRTGFAHLFEHMMFQGSRNLGKGEFISLVNSNGGILNGSTRYDFTNYFEVVPAHKTETFLWAEADRMRGLAITQENLTNQQGVVSNEVKVNVLNRPYGGFPWLDLPQLANENWYNAHNFYGDLKDIEAATLDDVHKFFDDFYAPNNAVVVVAGDIDPAQTLGWIEKYFGDIPASNGLVFPDISEPRQMAEKRREKADPLAPQPAVAWAYHVPKKGTPEYYAMILLDYILIQGDDSRLHEALVQQQGFGGSVSGGVNWPLGNAYNYNGPMLWSAFMIHDAGRTPDEVTAELDRVVADLQTNLVGAEEFNRAMTKARSAFYDAVGGNRIGLVDLLASFALFDDEPSRINAIEAELTAVTPELIRTTAREYLRPTNRSRIDLKPGRAGGKKQ